MAPSGPIKLAVIGCGRIAQAVHLPTLGRLAGVEITALADTDPGCLASARRLAPHAAAFADHRALLAEADASAVVVAVPTRWHGEVGRAVLGSGRHLYLEKPLATTRSEADAMVAAWRQHGTRGMIGFNYRYNPLNIEAAQLLAARRLGDILCVRSLFSDNGRELPPWLRARASGGGALLELGSHHLDLLPHLLGSPLAEIRAVLRSQRTEDDQAAVTATLADSTLVHSFFFFGSRQQDRIEIYGTRGRLVIDRFRSLRVEVTDDPEPPGRLARLRQTLAQVVRSPLVGDDLLAPARERSYDGAFGHFIDCLRAAQPPRPSLADGWRSLAAVLAAEESARRGHPVTVPALADESPAA